MGHSAYRVKNSNAKVGMDFRCFACGNGSGRERVRQ
jgi:hypothetical protein